jgi:hypothetical protein
MEINRTTLKDKINVAGVLILHDMEHGWCPATRSVIPPGPVLLTRGELIDRLTLAMRQRAALDEAITNMERLINAPTTIGDLLGPPLA